MSLIDKTYFVNEINLPDSQFSSLTDYITRYEPEILKRLLGYELWKLVSEYGTSPTQPIKNLVEGKEYTVSGQLLKWNGFKNADKVSLIAYYVYYWYVRNKNASFQTTGMRKQADENSVPASPILTLTGAWSILETLYGYNGQNFHIPSAYNFLSEFRSDYPTWQFRNIGNVNGFDL